jgi:hypothetical protein
MTHDEAIARCQELNQAPDREQHWFVKQTRPDDWELVSVDVPGRHQRGPLKESTQARPEPAVPPDPRPSVMRDLPAYGPY